MRKMRAIRAIRAKRVMGRVKDGAKMSQLMDFGDI